MILLRALLLGLLLLAIQALPANAAGNAVKVTVKITTTSGTVWGKVRLTYVAQGMTVKKTCAKAKCAFIVPKGVQLKLKETATDSTTWPFKGWVIRSPMGTKNSKAASVTWHATVVTTIQAVYTLPSGGGSSGSGWSP